MSASKEEAAAGDVKTEHASLTVVKRMFAVAVSSITYIRGIIPEEAYWTRYLEDLSIKILRGGRNTPRANKVIKWMMGCFDALEKRYLQAVLIGLYTNPEEPNCFIEYYQFKFRYTEKGPEMNILRNNAVTMEDTKKASVLLIRKLLLLMQNLGSLPGSIFLNMKLFYYDRLTPEEYQPPGFEDGECDSLWFEGTAAHFKVGDVQTPFHTLGLQVSAEQSRISKLQEGNHLKETSESNPEAEDKGQEDCQNKDVDEEDVPSEDESAQFKKPVRRLAKDCQNKDVEEEDVPSEDESAQFKKPVRRLSKRRAAVNAQSKMKRQKIELE